MKKLIALMALACMFAVGCKSDKGGTSEGNYSTSDTSTGKMQNDNSSTTTTTTNSSSTTPQQP
jgi:hypothetical protein